MLAAISFIFWCVWPFMFIYVLLSCAGAVIGAIWGLIDGIAIRLKHPLPETPEDDSRARRGRRVRSLDNFLGLKPGH